MALATIATVAALASTAYGIYNQSQQAGAAKDALAASDPFGPYRHQYALQLQTMMKDPSKALNDPAFQASLKLGEQGVARQMASQGYLGSGNEAIALQQYGMSQGMGYINQQEQFLAALAGAGIQPNAGPALSALNTANTGMGQGITSLLGQLGSALGGGK